MAQHLVNDLLSWKGVILMARAKATESQGPSEGIKGLKGWVSFFFQTCQRS